MKEKKKVSIEPLIREEDKPTLKDKIWNVVEKICITFSVGICGSFTYTMLNSRYKLNGAPSDRFLQNPYKVPVTMPISNKDIQVLIDTNFSTEQKQYIKQAVEELDLELTGVSYKIELDSSKSKAKSIKINRVDSDKTNGLAVTKFKTIGFFGYVNYPINMEVQIDKIAPQQNLNENDVDYLKGIIKHEMLHTLGFKDIYDDSLQNRTIMFYDCEKGPQYIHDLTEEDKNIANTVYAPKGKSDTRYDVSVSTPKHLNVVNAVSEDEDLSL